MPSQWHYSKGGTRLGPVSSARLRELAACGELGPGDLVWKEGMTEWRPAKSLRGLFPEPPAATSDPPPTPAAAAPPPPAEATALTTGGPGSPPPREADLFDRAREVAQRATAALAQAQAKAEAYQKEAQEKYARTVAQARQRLGQQPAQEATLSADPLTTAEGRDGPPRRPPTTLLDLGRGMARRTKEAAARAEEHLGQPPSTGTGGPTGDGRRPPPNRRVVGLAAGGSLLALCLLCGGLGSLLGLPKPRDGDGHGTPAPELHGDEERIQGEWTVVRNDGSEGPGFVFRGNTLTDPILGQGEESKFILDSTKRPKQITWERDHPNGHIVVEGIYEFKDEELYVCYNAVEANNVILKGTKLGEMGERLPDQAKSRPVEFGAIPPLVLMHRLRRVGAAIKDINSRRQGSSEVTSTSGLTPEGGRSSAAAARRELLETAEKFDGEFAEVVREIVDAVEGGDCPWSVADGRMYERRPGKHRFSAETVAAYRRWRAEKTAGPDRDGRNPH